MKTAIICAIILSSTVAGAETFIIDYPDHYYAESTGTAEAKSAPPPESGAPPATSAAASTAMPVVVPPESSATSPVSARPITNFEAARQPVDPAERRAAMNNEIRRLQRERGDLLAPKDGETAEDAARRQQRAAGMLRKINKMSSVLLNTE